MRIHSFRPGVSHFLSVSAIMFAVGACGVAASAQEFTSEFRILKQNDIDKKLNVSGSARRLDLNDQGDIVGVLKKKRWIDHDELLFHLAADGTYTELTQFGEYDNFNDLVINNNGTIGFNAHQGDGTNPYVYSNRTFTDISGTEEDTIWYVRDINDAGELVGTFDVGGRSGAWYYNPDTGMHDAGYTDWDGYSRSLSSINNAGEAIGLESHEGVEYFSHSYYTPETGMLDLGTYDTRSAGGLSINNNGDMMVSTSDDYRVIYGDSTTEVIGLSGILVTHQELNNGGATIGAFPDAYTPRPFFWRTDTGFIELNDLIPEELTDHLLTGTFQINDQNQILGVGQNDIGGFIWMIDLNIVPSPTSLLCLGMSICIIMGRRRNDI